MDKSFLQRTAASTISTALLLLSAHANAASVTINSASATSSNGTYVAGNAVDKNTGTRWEAASSASSLTVKFSGCQKIDDFTINWYGTSTYAYKAELSKDGGATWITVVPNTSGSGSANNKNVADQSANALRITSNNSVLRINEISLNSLGAGTVCTSTPTTKPTITSTPTVTPTASATPSPTATSTPKPSNTPTPTVTPIITVTPTSTPTSTPTPSPVPNNGLAVWVYTDLASQPSERTRFFNFAASHSISHVYLQSGKLLRSNQADLASFIAEAKTRQIDVTLLLGEYSWALSANHAKAIELADIARQFTASLAAAGRAVPVGVQFDVEPYALPEWDADMQSTANQFIDMLGKLQTTLRGAIPMSVTVPYWYDNRQITRLGKTRALSEWTIDATDSTVMMDYRDTAANISSGATSELAYAASKAKSMVVGVNIKCSSAAGYAVTTFCEEGEAAMLAAVKTSQASLAQYPSLGGFAVFSYEAWLMASDDYITFQSGNLPVVLSAPHGGEVAIADIPIRLNGETVRDLNTYQLANAIQNQLFAKTGKRAHLVAARVSRKYIDFNRTADLSYEHDLLKPLYDRYYGVLKSTVAAAKLQAPAAALLVDLHAQGDTASLIYRGTQNGKTALNTALYAAPDGLVTTMKALGLMVNPSTAAGAENTRFTGGNIVMTFGRNNSDGINSVQFEFGYDFRDTQASVDRTASKLADAIIAHLRANGVL